MAEVPGCFIAHTYGTLDLARGNAFLGLAEQQGSHEPLGKGQVGVVKDRARCDRELIIAGFAVE